MSNFRCRQIDIVGPEPLDLLSTMETWIRTGNINTGNVSTAFTQMGGTQQSRDRGRKKERLNLLVDNDPDPNIWMGTNSKERKKILGQ